MGLVSLPLNECEVEVDLVLTQTSFVFLWKCMLGKNNMIYMYTTKLQGLYQNNVNSRTISITVKWAKEDTLKWNCNSCYTRIWLLAIQPTQQSQIPFVVSGLNESVYILTSFRLGICSSACPFKLISNTCRQSDSLHLSS